MNTKFFELSQYYDRESAQIARSKLESEGVAVILTGEHAHWAHPGLVGPISLFVPYPDVIRARHIMERVAQGRDECESLPDAPDNDASDIEKAGQN